jgi:hypothetical protein
MPQQLNPPNQGQNTTPTEATHGGFAAGTTTGGAGATGSSEVEQAIAFATAMGMLTPELEQSIRDGKVGLNDLLGMAIDGGKGKDEKEPVDRGTTAGFQSVDPDVLNGTKAYMTVWGVEPPKGYIQKLVAAGMSPYEIMDNELAKDSAKRTPYYRDTYARFAHTLSQMFARR